MNYLPQFHAELDTPRDDVAVVALEGDVDIYSAPQFKEVLMRSIEQGRDRVIVDLTRATFIDSTALGVLVNGAKKARKGMLSIVCSDTGMVRIFDIVGLQCIFAVYETLQAALRDGQPQESASL